MATRPSRPSRSRTSSMSSCAISSSASGRASSPLQAITTAPESARPRMAGVLVLFPRRHGALHGLRHRHGHLRAAILWWFCSDAEVVHIGAETLRFSCIVLPLLAVSTFVNQLYQCLGYRTGRDVPGKLQAGHFLPSGRAAPAAVAALRRCGDEPTRGRPSDLRDLPCRSSQHFTGTISAGMQSKLNKKIRGEKPRIFFARFKYSIYHARQQAFPSPCQQLAHETPTLAFSYCVRCTICLTNLQ